MKYLVIYETTPSGFSAYVPDLPGCVAAGDSRDEVRELMAGAIAMHVEAMRESGEPIPEPSDFELAEVSVG